MMCPTSTHPRPHPGPHVSPHCPAPYACISFACGLRYNAYFSRYLELDICFRCSGTPAPNASGRSSLARDGVRPRGLSWTLARYNDPSTPGPFRRNEVLLPLEDDFDIWQ